ncbi:MAG: hypothetical protein N3A01_05180 [Bacteroidales bacterium]|nr:hypothetical protein [Bacteroidales bacterium]
MGKLLIVLIVLIGFINIHYGQTLEVDWGKPFPIQKGTWYLKIVGSDKDGIFLLKSDSPIEPSPENTYLDYYNVYSHSIESSNQLILPSINGYPSNFYDLFYIENKLILLTTANIGNNKELYIQYLNRDATLKNIPKKIGSIPITNYEKDNFKMIFYNNKFYFLYYNSFVAYNKENINIKIVNSDLLEEAAYNIVLPLIGESFEIEQYTVGKSGFIYFLLKHYLKEKKSKPQQNNVEEKYEYVLVTYNPKRKEVNKYEIKPGGGKYNAVNAIIGLDSEERVVVTGFIANKSVKVAKEFIGAYYIIINPRTQKIESTDMKKTIRIFSKDFIAQNAEERNGATPELYNNYKLRSIFFFEEGGFAVISENSYVIGDDIVDPATKKVTHIDYYVHNDLILYGVNKEGVLSWNFRIPKNQVSTDDKGYYNSYLALYENNKIKIFFNDQKANMNNKVSAKTKVLKNFPTLPPKGYGVLYSVFADGSYEKYPAFKPEDEKWVIMPNLISYFNRRYVLFVQEGRTIKSGTFIIE